MSKVDWCALLGWDEEQLRGLRCSGWAYIRQGRYEAALKVFKALVILDARNPYHFEMLGAVYLQLGNYQEAIRWLDRGLKIDPYHEPSMVNKAKALLLLGYRQEGLALAREAQKSVDQTISDRAEALILAYE